ncbi:hypothetical protein RUND412_005500 [Rhizina undulata]
MRPTSTEALGQGGGNNIIVGRRSRKSSSAEPGGGSGSSALAASTSAPAAVGAVSTCYSAGDEYSSLASGSGSMTYFLADEATVMAASGGGGNGLSSSGSFGVRSLDNSVEDTMALPRRSGRPTESEGPSTREEDEKNVHDSDEDDLDSHSVASLRLSVNPDSFHRSPQQLLSQPLTPLMGPSPDPQSLPMSPSGISFRSDDDLQSEVAVEDYGSPRGRSQKPVRKYMPLSESSMVTPQLIMPEITIPSRRPFTEKGKRVGRLKVLIAGDSGIGKTSLIKSIVQICEDIVHVDPMPMNQSFSRGSNSKAFHSLAAGRSDGSSGNSESTKKITEIYASTKPYPRWWSELDDSRVLRRRKSSKASAEEQVIERNLCFVDTPGYGAGTSFLECVEPVVRYVEAQLDRTHAILNTGSGDLLSVLSGDGTPQVDIVFYVVLHRLKNVDIEFIRRLSTFTNVLPVIAKADTLAPQQVNNLKLSILAELRAAGVRPFLFGKTQADVSKSIAEWESCPPFAISSTLAPDTENMDASILMSPDYVPPLVETELNALVECVFDPDNINWLRHASAKKYLEWSMNASAASLVTSLQPSATSPPPRRRNSASSRLGSGFLTASNSSLVHVSGVGASSSSSSSSNPAASSFALARVADHTQREERYAQIRLTRWAQDLHRSLKAERERYERVARGERAIWLTERLKECIADGQLVPTGPNALEAKDGSGMEVRNEGVGVDMRDPLGLLAMQESIRKKMAMVLKLLGYGGIVGLFGMWVANKSFNGEISGLLGMGGQRSCPL